VPWEASRAATVIAPPTLLAERLGERVEAPQISPTTRHVAERRSL
jgi:hypothetical protein